MHIYLYDSYVNERKYESTIARIETRITDLGLNGKIIRLGVMNSVYAAVADELKKGANTFVAVGNNNIFNQLIGSVAALTDQDTFKNKFPIGFIPVGKQHNDIAAFLGIGLEEEACDVLSARRVESFDLGLANNNFFLSKASIPTLGTNVEIDKNYSIEITEKGTIDIINMPINIELPETTKVSAKDGVLEMLIRPKNKKRHTGRSFRFISDSVFSFKKITIQNNLLPVVLDDSVEIKTPVTISLASVKTRLIVGKNKNVT